MMMLSFIFLIKLRVVWEMLIESSVRSRRDLLNLLWEETQNVVTFTMGKMKPYIKVQSTGLGTWNAENLHQNSRKGCEVGNWGTYLELKRLEDGNT